MSYLTETHTQAERETIINMFELGKQSVNSKHVDTNLIQSVATQLITKQPENGFAQGGNTEEIARFKLDVISDMLKILRQTEQSRHVDKDLANKITNNLIHSYIKYANENQCIDTKSSHNDSLLYLLTAHSINSGSPIKNTAITQLIQSGAKIDHALQYLLGIDKNSTCIHPVGSVEYAIFRTIQEAVKQAQGEKLCTHTTSTPKTRGKENTHEM